jgi:hypothetical protein
MALRLPTKLPERGIAKDHARAINQLIEAVQSIQPVPAPGQRIERTANGTVLKTQSGGSSDAQESWFY